MTKAYWISLYLKVDNQENLKKYAETCTPIIKSYGGKPLVRGGKYSTIEGDNFLRTVIWEFPSYEKNYGPRLWKSLQFARTSNLWPQVFDF